MKRKIHQRRAPIHSGKRDVVFVVHGRNDAARDEISKFLEQLDLEPMVWREAVALTGKTSPPILEVVQGGIQKAQAVIVLFTPDEYVQLRKPFVGKGEEDFGYQPRPNVILEAGMALALHNPKKTILVQIGRMREISDLAGIHYVQLNNSREKRDDLVRRLEQAGCKVRLSKHYSNRRVAGDFDQVLPVEQDETHFLELGVIRGDEILYAGVSYLREQSHKSVFIYAPTGVWEYTRAKKMWFCALAACLANAQKEKRPSCADKSVTTTLGEFIGVYGLPAKLENLPRAKRKEVSTQLDTIEKLLAPFNGLKTAFLYYLKTDAETIPGTGAIIIDDSIFLGFAIARRHKVDYGLWFPEQRNLTTDIRRWFTNYVTRIAETNILQDMTQKVSLTQGMEAIRSQYGLTLAKQKP